jgi:FAD:protein FMN transferase
MTHPLNRGASRTRSGLAIGLRLSLPALFLVAASCRRDPPSAQNTWLCMGTFCSVSVPAAEQHQLTALTAQAREISDEVNRRLTVYTNTSEIAVLNRNAGTAAVPVSEMTLEILALSKEYAEHTGGAFDVTIGPLVRAWGFNTGTAPAHTLDRATLDAALARIGSRHIVLRDNTAFLAEPDIEVDLGGIAKGYAVDLCYDALVTRGQTNLMVNIGGNLRCVGSPRNGRPWNVGVRHPLQHEAILGTLLMTDGMAIATSGNYERFVEIDGRRYAHILDPRTGLPVEGMAGVTVLCKSATRADALSTALFVLGPEASRTVFEAYPDVDALFVPDEQPLRILVTPGFAARFHPCPNTRSTCTYCAPDRVISKG